MNGKIYYTDEEVDRDHKRFRICKNRGNDCKWYKEDNCR